MRRLLKKQAFGAASALFIRRTICTYRVVGISPRRTGDRCLPL